MDDQLKNALLKVSERISKERKLSNLNCGGCGVFAAIVVKQFKLNENCLEWLYKRRIDMDVRNKEVAGVYHVLINVGKDTAYDSKGFHYSKYHGYELTPINYSYLALTLRDIDNWNFMFNRSLTPIIHKIVKEEAEKYHALKTI